MIGIGTWARETGGALECVGLPALSESGEGFTGATAGFAGFTAGATEGMLAVTAVCMGVDSDAAASGREPGAAAGVDVAAGETAGDLTTRMD